MAQALLIIIAFSPFKKTDNDIQREHTGVETQLSAINGFHSDLLQNNFLIVFPILQETTFYMLSKDTHPKRKFLSWPWPWSFLFIENKYTFRWILHLKKVKTYIIRGYSKFSVGGLARFFEGAFDSWDGRGGGGDSVVRILWLGDPVRKTVMNTVRISRLRFLVD